MSIPNSNQSKIDESANSISNRNIPSMRGSLITSKDFFTSFKYASHGLIYSFKSQRNFRIHVFCGLLASCVAILIDLPASHLAIIVITIASVLVLELINTSIESVVDLAIGKSFHPLARIAKDCAAASVLVASAGSILIAILLILLPLLRRLAF